MKNKKALVLLFIANAISGFAQGLTMLSIPYHFQSTNNFTTFMISVVIITFGSLFWGLYSGALVDGFNRKDVLLGTNFMGGLIIFSVAFLGYREAILPTSLILLVYTTTLYGYIIHFPNLYAFSQEITDQKDYSKIVSYIEVVGQATAMASAALGGVLLGGIDIIQEIPGTTNSLTIIIEKWELHEIFLMDSIAFFLSFGIVLFIKYQPLKKDTIIDEADLKERLKEGYDYLKNNPLILIFGICSYSIFIVVLVEIFILLFPYVLKHLQEGPDVLGLSEMLFASGSLVSGIMIRYIFSRISIPKSIIILTYLTSAAFLIVSFSTSVLVFYIFCLIIGLTNAGSRIFRVTYLFNLIPNELTGRVNSIFNVVTTMCRILLILLFLSPFFRDNLVTHAYIVLSMFTLISAIFLTYLYKPLLKLTKTASSNNKPH